MAAGQWHPEAPATIMERVQPLTQHALPRDRQLLQSDRPRSPDDGKRGLPQLRALDPMPVLGGAGGVSSILNCVLKLAPATSTTDITGRAAALSHPENGRPKLLLTTIFYVYECHGYSPRPELW